MKKLLCLAAALVSLAGCRGVKRAPVTGNVMLDGKPMKGGVLRFSPNTAKGNQARVNCTGPVHDGRYELRTSGVLPSETGAGVPPGWYKVVVVSNLPGAPKVDVNSKYTSEATTPLEIEVVDNPPPGRYDIQLER
jgi:hypothetical protein